MSLGAPGNWPESKVLHIKQNRLILLPARSINMQEYGLWKPAAIGFRCSELRSQGLTLDPDVYETKQRSVYHLPVHGSCKALGSNQSSVWAEKKMGVQKWEPNRDTWWLSFICMDNWLAYLCTTCMPGAFEDQKRASDPLTLKS